jgi:hypothetical protein
MEAGFLLRTLLEDKISSKNVICTNKGAKHAFREFQKLTKEEDVSVNSITLCRVITNETKKVNGRMNLSYLQEIEKKMRFVSEETLKQNWHEKADFQRFCSGIRILEKMTLVSTWENFHAICAEFISMEYERSGGSKSDGVLYTVFEMLAGGSAVELAQNKVQLESHVPTAPEMNEK